MSKDLQSDDAVLDFIFQGGNKTLYSPSGPPSEGNEETSTIPIDSEYFQASTQLARDVIIAKRLEMTVDELSANHAKVASIVQLANSGPVGLETAQSELSDLLSKYPKFIPALNSRSQIVQILAAILAKSTSSQSDSEEKSKTLQRSDNMMKESLGDLTLALEIFEETFPEYQAFKEQELSTNHTLPPKFFVQALTQRGMGYDLLGNRALARKDLTFASNLGGAFARQQLIAMNPLAQLNNETMSEVFAQLKPKSN